MIFKITGQVRESERKIGMPDLVVRAFDKDLIYDDLLGSVTTDENGCFEIICEETDYRELFDKRPDIYLTIKSPDYSRVLHTTEEKVRFEADKEEHFIIDLPRKTLGDLAPPIKYEEVNKMAIWGDNPFDDGLDFVGCPPKPTRLKLPKFPEHFESEGKLICWGRCMSVPDGERMMKVVIDDFEPDPNRCGVYNGEVHFIDAVTGDEWYKGELKFYYTRNYIYTSTSTHGDVQKSIAFRFVAKGDIVRVSDDMPEWQCFILCTKKTDEVKSYEKILVYGGLDILCDIEGEEYKDFMLALGHNDGWYTHHPECSKRPIDWTGYGDYIGHYCERGWLFVSPGRNFVFNPNINPPTGRFFEEALREVGSNCYTEEAIEYGSLNLSDIRCIHSYQNLKGVTDCDTPFNSTKFCQGLVYSGRREPWITFFSMGYWMDRYEKSEQILHLVEGNIKVGKDEYKRRYENGLYFYGFATQNYREELKLVDLASNKDDIGVPADSELLLYLYNVGVIKRNPKLRRIIPIDPRLSAELLREEIEITKDKDICPFLQEIDKLGPQPEPPD